MKTKKCKLYSRKCDVTGKGINDGYVFGIEERIFSEEKHLINHLRNEMKVDPENRLSDEYILKESYEQEEYHYTVWTPDSINEICYDAKGNIVSEPSKEPKVKVIETLAGYLGIMR